MVVYIYENEDCQKSLIFLHHPLYRALESHSLTRISRFSHDEKTKQVEASVVHLWLQSVELTFQDPERVFYPLTGMTETMLPACMFRLFLYERAHWESRVCTAFGKYLVQLGLDPESNYLDGDFLNYVHRNQFLRERGMKGPSPVEYPVRRKVADCDLRRRIVRHLSAEAFVDGGIDQCVADSAEMIEFYNGPGQDGRRRESISKKERLLDGLELDQLDTQDPTSTLHKRIDVQVHENHREWLSNRPTEARDTSEWKSDGGAAKVQARVEEAANVEAHPDQTCFDSDMDEEDFYAMNG